MTEHFLAAASSLPIMIDRAASALTSARSAAEVLEARDMAGVAYDMAKKAARLARAKDAHDSLIAAAHRAQADALEIEAKAKRRLADEYDAAQPDGHEKGGRPKTVGDPNGFTAASVGLSRYDIHEARLIRDAEAAEPGLVRRVLDEKLEAGEEPTKAALREAVLYVARHGYSAPRESRRNPLYVKPSAVDSASTLVRSHVTSMLQAAEGFSAAEMAAAVPNDIERQHFTGEAQQVVALLRSMIEACHD